MIHNQTHDASTGDLYDETIDLAADTYTLSVNGVEMLTGPVPADVRAAYTPPPEPASADVLAAIKAQPTVTKRVDALLAAIEAGTLVL